MSSEVDSGHTNVFSSDYARVRRLEFIWNLVYLFFKPISIGPRCIYSTCTLCTLYIIYSIGLYTLCQVLVALRLFDITNVKRRRCCIPSPIDFFLISFWFWILNLILFLLLMVIVIFSLAQIAQYRLRVSTWVVLALFNTPSVIGCWYETAKLQLFYISCGTFKHSQECQTALLFHFNFCIWMQDCCQDLWWQSCGSVLFHSHQLFAGNKLALSSWALTASPRHCFRMGIGCTGGFISCA